SDRHRDLHSFPTRRSSDLLLERESAARASVATEATEALKRQAQVWAEEIAADSDIGGEKLEESKELAKRALDKYLPNVAKALARSEEHTSELQSRENLVCR